MKGYQSLACFGGLTGAGEQREVGTKQNELVVADLIQAEVSLPG